MWTIKDEHGATFGPATLVSLQAWARDGRLAPNHFASQDGENWQPVTSLLELEMDWVAEISPSVFYGPIHSNALEELIKEGSLPSDCQRFKRGKDNSSRLSRQVAERDSRIKQLESRLASQTEELEDSKNSLKESEGKCNSLAAELSAIQDQQAAEGGRLSKLQDEIERLRQQQSALRSLLGEALDQLQSPSPAVELDEGVTLESPVRISPVKPPPPRAPISLNEIEVQAQREIQQLGKQAGNIFAKRK